MRKTPTGRRYRTCGRSQSLSRDFHPDGSIKKSDGRCEYRVYSINSHDCEENYLGYVVHHRWSDDTKFKGTRRSWDAYFGGGGYRCWDGHHGHKRMGDAVDALMDQWLRYQSDPHLDNWHRGLRLNRIAPGGVIPPVPVDEGE